MGLEVQKQRQKNTWVAPGGVLSQGPSIDNGLPDPVFSVAGEHHLIHKRKAERMHVCISKQQRQPEPPGLYWYLVLLGLASILAEYWLKT